MRPHPRRARTDPRSPRAWGTSDHSGFVGNQENMVWQLEWAGLKLINKKLLVFPDEYDTPNRQLGSIIIPPDPPPVMNARPENYAIDEQPVSLLTTESGVTLVLDGKFAHPVELMLDVQGNL